jgi:hypothetical protein
METCNRSFRAEINCCLVCSFSKTCYHSQVGAVAIKRRAVILINLKSSFLVTVMNVDAATRISISEFGIFGVDFCTEFAFESKVLRR